MKPWIGLLCATFMLTSCASDIKHEGTAKEDYEYARHLLDEGRYDMANVYLEKFDSRHPYSHYSIQAELLRIFAAYKNGEYILSETLAQRFIDRHPRHPHVDYAKYMLGMSHYHEISKAERDPTQMRAAIEAFKRLIHDHPQSSYVKDASARLQLLYNRLAEHELAIGKFYFDRERYVAAANRFQIILKEYQTTPVIDQALYYLATSYARLGLQKEASDVAKLLRYNYPASKWSNKVADYIR